MKADARVLFRADGGAGIGAGHLTRCGALAEALRQNGGISTLATRASARQGLTDWESAFASVIELREPADAAGDEAAMLARHLDAEWVVADIYDPAELRRLRAGYSGRFAVLADFVEQAHGADLVVDGSAGADKKPWPPAKASARHLLGPRFAMLKPAIAGASATGGGGILITFGAADEENVGLSVFRALAATRISLPITLAAPVGAEAEAEARRIADGPRGALRILPLGPILDPMRHTDIAVCGAGLTALEFAFLGVPMVVLPIADNQRRAAEGIAESGAAVEAESVEHAVEAAIALAADAGRRAEMARKGRALVDGRGAARVASVMTGRA